MQDDRTDDSAPASIDGAEGPGPQETGAPDAKPEQPPFRPGSQMSRKEWEHWGREADRLYPKVNRRYA